MIDRTTGQLQFTRGQQIRPDGLLPPDVLEESPPCHAEGWVVYPLGVWHSEHGPFVVGVAVDSDLRIRGALLCHWVADYAKRNPDDPERHAFHQEVIHSDLGGQREFSWGRVDCRHDAIENRNWLVVTYAVGPHVPVPPPQVFGHLCARESEGVPWSPEQALAVAASR